MINVLLTMRTVDNATYPERRDAIAHDFPRFLERLGIRPLLVPNVSRDPEGYIAATSAKGLILSGGNDPAFRPDGDEISESRDHTELRLLEAAVARRLPVFGVCRGLQIINHFFGGSLSRLDQGHVAHDHDVIFRTAVCGRATDSVMTVNSFHNLGVRLNDRAPDLTTFAASHDGVVEGIECPEKNIAAVQWHPERQSPSAEFDNDLIRDWVSRCAK